MRHAREKSSTEQGHAERDARVRKTKASEHPVMAVMAARGLTLEGMGNRALLSFLRAGHLQRKPRASGPRDPFEREADRAADAVIAGEHAALTEPLRAPAPEIQRMASEDEMLATSLDLEPERSRAAPQAASPPAEGCGAEIIGLLDGGRSLDEQTRALMEDRFGESFSEVRIHTGDRASDAADSVHSRAFTVGEDIVFADKEFAPETVEGRRLLAHELAHVVQQHRSLGALDDKRAAERDARDAAQAVTSGGTPAVRERASRGSVQKQERPLDEAAKLEELKRLKPAQQYKEPLPPGGAPAPGEHYGPAVAVQTPDPAEIHRHDIEEMARLHGATEGRLYALRRETAELMESAERGTPTRLSLEHFPFFIRDALLDRVNEIEHLEQSGYAELSGADDKYHSVVFERAIEGGLIQNEQDQELFLRIAHDTEQSVKLQWAIWRAVELAASFVPGEGAAGALFARAPGSTPTALAALNKAVEAVGIEGRYANVVEFASERALKFQSIVSKGIAAGTSFIQRGVKFDYFDVGRKVLVDAKGPGYANFINKKTGVFYGWFKGREALVDQAQRQLRAANGMAIEWVFQEKSAMEVTKELLKSRLTPRQYAQFTFTTY